jgi:hypothetical protein
VSDSFSYGAPARHRRRAGSVDTTKIALGLLALALLVGGAVVVFSVLRDGGEAAASSASEAVGQIDVARDAEAQVVLTRVAMAAQAALAQSDTGTPDAATAEALGQVEPAFTYTTEASTGPGVVSVAATSEAWSAAVRSASGTCLWVRLGVDGVQTFGSGTPCTGTAAASAGDPSW